MATIRSATDWRTLGSFAAVSAVTISLGSYGLSLYGAGVGTWSRNPIAWLAGCVLAVPLLLTGRSRRMSIGVLALTVLALAATLLAQDQSGVHRWLDIGPVHVNVAALLLPVAVVALSTSNLAPAVLLAIMGAIGAILVAQPDASQATAFLLASALVLFRCTKSPGLRAIGLVGMGGLALAAWLRGDPLQPVPEVEGVFLLLVEVSKALAAAAGAALALTCAVPLRRLASSSETTGQAALGLSVYFVASAVMPFFGAYPVPLLGVGMSFPVGFWLAMALLSAREHRSD